MDDRRRATDFQVLSRCDLIESLWTASVSGRRDFLDLMLSGLVMEVK